MDIGNLRISVGIAKDKLQASLQELKTAFKQTGDNLESNFSKSQVFEKLKNKAKQTTKTIGGLNDKLRLLKNELEGAEIGSKKFRELQKEINKTSKALDRATGKISIFQKVGSTLLTVFSIGAISQFTRSLFNLTSKIEQVKISFETLLGSAKQADELFNNLTIFASKTPFNRLELTKSAQKLLGFGFAGKQVLPIMKSVGDSVSAIGGNQETLNGVILALGQIKAKGKLSSEELMQMAERGLPVFEILQEKLGLTKEQIGNIGNEAISANEAIPALLEGLNEKFAGSMENQSQTLAGKWSNMIDNLEAKMSDLGAKLSPFFSWIIGKINAIIVPILIILGKIVDGVVKTINKIKKDFIKFKVFFKKNLYNIQKYFDKFLQIFVSSFVGALVFLKRKTIVEFLAGTIRFIIFGITRAIFAIIAFSNTIIPNTIYLFKNTIAKTYNRIASIKLTRANLLTSFSFKKLSRSIFGVTKRLLILGLKFFAIAGIVFLIVTSIYKNWNKLKNKLKPIFSFIAEIGKAAPEIIAEAWNMLVSGIATVVKSMLGTTEKLVNALNYIPGVDINTDGIKEAVVAVDKFANSIKITGKDVKGVFNSIKNGAKGILDDFTDLGDLGKLKSDLFDIKANFKDIGDTGFNAGKQTAAGAKKASKALNKEEKQAKKLKKELEKKQKEEKKLLKEFFKEIKDEYKDYKEDLKKIGELHKENTKEVIEYNFETKRGIKEVKLELEDFYKEIKEKNNDYLDQLEDIEKKYRELNQAEQDAKLKDKKDIAKRNLEILKEKKSLEEQIAKAMEKQKYFKKLISKLHKIDEKLKKEHNEKEILKYESKRAKILEEIGKKFEKSGLLTEKQYKLQKKLKKLNAEQKLNTGILDGKILEKVKKEAEESKTEKILKNAEKRKKKYLEEKEEIRKNYHEKQKEWEKEKKQQEKEQQALEKKLEIRQFFQNKERLSQEELNKLLQNKNFMRLDKEQQDLIISEAKKKIAITKKVQEELDLKRKIANETIKINNQITKLQLHNLDLIGKKEKALTQIIAGEIKKRLALYNLLNRANPGTRLNSINIPKIPSQTITNSKNISNVNKNTQIVKNINLNLNGVSVRNDADIDKISDKVYEKIRQETETGNKNFY